jgi:hypothetical protein
MKVLQQFRALVVFVVVFAGFAPVTAFAAGAGSDSAACQAATFVVDESALVHMTGTYIPSLSGASCSLADLSAPSDVTAESLDAAVFLHMTGTYLPGLSGGSTPSWALSVVSR